MVRSRTTTLVVFLCLASIGAVGQDTLAKAQEIPELNARIAAFARAQKGKKVGAGECWDLAAEALRRNDAKWDGMYGFGELIDWRKHEVMPGDIVQFENVELEHREGNMVSRERYGKHTAVVIEVRDRGDYELAHQNVQPLGKKVGFSRLEMTHVRTGKLLFYRPVE